MFSVSIRKIGKLEVDFIVRNIINNSYSYIQVSRTIDNGIVNEKVFLLLKKENIDL